MFFGRTDAKAETPVLWPPHVKSSLIGKNSDAGRDWGQEEKRTTEDEMVGCHHQLLEFTQTHVHQVGDAIQPPHPFSSCPQSFPASGSLQMTQLFTSGDQSIGALGTVHPMNSQG